MLSLTTISKLIIWCPSRNEIFFARSRKTKVTSQKVRVYLKGYVNKFPGKENRFSSASNALNSWLVRFLYEMAGCLRSAVLLALCSNLIETIGRLPGLFEKLQTKILTEGIH
jgi:hypothetical protein